MESDCAPIRLPAAGYSALQSCWRQVCVMEGHIVSVSYQVCKGCAHPLITPCLPWRMLGCTQDPM